jgi:hypothetical protein
MEMQPCRSPRDRRSACFGNQRREREQETRRDLGRRRVGYSRLAGADEDRTLARLRRLRSDLIDPAIAAHHGRIVKRTGDGSIIEFRSVVDAVRCAIEVQTGLIERNSGVPEDRRIQFRVGIHVGDVVEESDGDLMGDGVRIVLKRQLSLSINGQLNSREKIGSTLGCTSPRASARWSARKRRPTPASPRRALTV